MPFYGRLDDVRLYNQVLDERSIQRLYENSALTLRLPLDDPPGTRNFSEASPVRAEVGCTSCPTAGLRGRVDGAASFGGLIPWSPNGSPTASGHFQRGGLIRPNSWA
jgi:hypothetical protein